MFNYLKKSIARKLSVTIAIIVLVIFIVTGLLIYDNTKTQLLEGIEKEISLNSNRTVEDIAKIFEESIIVTNQMALNRQITGYIEEVDSREDMKIHSLYDPVMETLADIQKTEEVFASSWIANYEANFFTNNERYLPKKDDDVRTRPWYPIANAGNGVVFTNPYVDIATGKKLVSAVQAIKDKNENIGVVGIDIALETIPGIMEKHRIGEKGKNILVSSSGSYIYTEDDSEIIYEKVTDDPILNKYVKAALNGERDIEKVTYDGVKYYLAYEPISINGWAVLSLVNEAEIMSPLKITIFKLISAFILGCLVLIILSYIAITKNIKPIKNLVEASNKIAVGEVDISIKSTSKDEIGTLATAFQRMIENIKNQATVIEKIASGDLSIEVEAKSENDVLAHSMKSVVGTLRNLVGETEILTNAAIEGNFEVRGNVKKFNGGYRDIIEGVNATLNTFVGHIDNIAIPVMVIDKDYNIKYINKIGAEVSGATQTEVIGTKCYDNFKTSDCNTKKCACNAAMKENQKKSSETDAHPNGMNMEIFYSAIPIKNHSGKIIGAMESVIDHTDVKQAAEVAKKQTKYQKMEVDKLLKDIENLAEGKLIYNAEISKTDEDTKELGETFDKIYKSYSLSIDSISSYIGEISKILNEISNGNLEIETKIEYKGDFAEIKTSLNNIISSLNEILSDINTAAEQVASGSGQVSQSSVALSQGATEQASSVEELTATIEEITAQTKQNAQNANRAKEITEEAKIGAASGNVEMQKMLEAMEGINESSKNISKIIKVIDEIAFQTNILSLNAAVEAARAGEHGKGFAVVAEEVRNLASRSANAAKETTQLIEGSIIKVQEGTKIANNTAEALYKIVEGASKAANLVGDIAVASNEQAIGVNQVNEGINLIANVVQTTSATSEETASASEELSSQAEMLKNQVSKFKLKDQNETFDYKGMEELNPEVLRMLQDMSIEYKDISNQSGKEKTKDDDDTILLRDSEFEKY